MTIHEPKHRATDSQRRALHPSIVARKSSRPDGSGTNALRQRFGNRGVQRLMSEIIGSSNGSAQTRSPAIQTKLTVSQPGDVHEQEADRVANAVMRMPAPEASRTSQASMTTPAAVVQRSCTNCEEEHALAKLEKETEGSGSHIHRKETSSAGAPAGKEKGPLNFSSRGVSGGRGISSAPPIVHEVLRSPGQHLDASTRAFFEPRFGSDFGDIRVHTDSTASKSAAAVDARAYTAGKNIVFGAGQYSPHSRAGQRLLAHELVHTVQQRTGVVSPSSIQREPAGGCGLCYADPIYNLRGPQNAGIAVHKAIQNELAPKGGGTEAEFKWGNGKVDLAVVRHDLKQVAIAEIKPANERGIDDGIKQIEQRLRVLPKLKPYHGYEWVKLDKPVAKRIRFATDAPVCMPPYAAQPGYCFSQDLSVAGPVMGLLYLYFCEPGYKELLKEGCSCKCKEPKDKKPKDKKPSDNKPEPSDSFRELLKELGKELGPWLARAGVLDIGLALARVMLAWVSAPLAALAAVVLGIAFFWDDIKSIASKIAGVAQAVWDRIAGLASFVRGAFTTILGKISDLGIKLAELGGFLAGTIASFVKKLAEGALLVARKIAEGGKWVGRKIASGAEAFWDWLWGSDVQPIYPVIDIPIKEETTKCATVAYEDTVVRLDTDLLFPTSGWELTEKADAVLKDAARRIGSMLQKDDWIKFEGYADIIPKRDATLAESDRYNQKLSVQRAEAVRSWFVAQGVVPSARTRVEGYGRTKAKAPADDVKGREKDRRVDIWLPQRGGTRKMCW